MRPPLDPSLPPDHIFCLCVCKTGGVCRLFPVFFHNIFTSKNLALPCFFPTLWKRNKARALARFAWPENNSSMNKFVEKTNIEDLDECAILPRPLLLRQQVEPHPLLAHKHNQTPSMNSYANSAYHMSAWINRKEDTQAGTRCDQTKGAYAQLHTRTL